MSATRIPHSSENHACVGHRPGKSLDAGSRNAHVSKTCKVPVTTVIVQHRQRTHRLWPSLRPFEVHLPELVGLTALEALRCRRAALICSDQIVTTQNAMYCAATANPRGPTAPEAFARPSRDNATATRSPAAPTHCRCGADCD